eukprot:365859-Chlamydomonas_euryale.AAC.6
MIRNHRRVGGQTHRKPQRVEDVRGACMAGGGMATRLGPRLVASRHMQVRVRVGFGMGFEMDETG